MRWFRVSLISLLAIGAGYALGTSSRTDSPTRLAHPGSTTSAPSDGPKEKRRGKSVLLTNSPQVESRSGDSSPGVVTDPIQTSFSSAESVAELRHEAIDVGLALAPDPTEVSPADRLVQFMNALEEPVRDGLAFYGEDRLPIFGRSTEIRVLLNLYNGVRHGEELTDLKDACWSVQIEVEGYSSSGALDYGAGCGRTTGLRDGKLYVHAEVYDPKLRQIYSYFALPLPDGSKSGVLQVFSVTRKKWERISDWSWTAISGEEFKRHEEELRRRARDSRP